MGPGEVGRRKAALQAEPDDGTKKPQMSSS